MLEKNLEQKLRKRIKAMGGKFYKWVSPGNNGVPDRIAIFPGGRIWFIEMKKEDGELSPLQEFTLEELTGLGCNTAVIYTEAEMEVFLNDKIGYARLPKLHG